MRFCLELGTRVGARAPCVRLPLRAVQHEPRTAAVTWQGTPEGHPAFWSPLHVLMKALKGTWATKCVRTAVLKLGCDVGLNWTL